MVWVRSASTSTWIAGGMAASMLRQRAFDAVDRLDDVGARLLEDARRRPTGRLSSVSAGTPGPENAQPPTWVFSTPSTARPMSLTRIGAPLW